MAGELNGHDVGVAIDGDNDGNYTDLGGVTENSFTLNNAGIETQSKTTSEWRQLMDGEGLQNVDMNVTVIFNSSSTMDVIRSYARNKSLGADFQIARGAQLMQGKFYVQNYQETAPDNDKLTATFSLISSGTVTGI